MGSSIRTINSEVEIKQDLYRSFKLTRAFEQKAFYLGKGAQIYYDKLNIEGKSHIKPVMKQEDLFIFFKENIACGKEPIAFVSLGCGNSKREKEVLKRVHDTGYEIIYFGVDSSMTMLQSAEQTLLDCPFEKVFICADFSLDSFKRELNKLLKAYNKRVFALFGNTLGNVPQNFIADTLRNILKKGDILWLEVLTVKDLDDETAAKQFECYLRYISDPDTKSFFTYPLQEIGINPEDGELIVEMKKEQIINSLLFIFSFKANKKIEFLVEDEIVTLLPESTIEMLDIMAYSKEELIKFFETRQFKFKSSGSNKAGGPVQFAFEKL
ncbi:L-histidine N(alpha)-methyltransferase [Candidatus Woesearchaeota archaeon]|nr:L-histidine N(alpha)-methyltransferase [Nanoarchaeota archaeon]MCB9370877.1 L-histidine N(alpha)-methyltransferase [Candidatus Woesearchaeota archaeon]USN43979.1 MAG: L-histidine N(alpha)-methyltransferase [Candidatus Woesearchaeota archaeon]